MQLYSMKNPEINFHLDVNCDLPNTCPYCNLIIRPINKHDFLSGRDIDFLRDFRAVFLLQCPACNEFFTSIFALENFGINEAIGTLIDYPKRPLIKIDFPEEIKSVSPSFFKIYEQALIAELEGLDSICGLGFRKALEFLIKDYLIFVTPELGETIKSEALGKSINRIDNEQIQTLARAATWLGNDEAHYVRKHSDKSIKHMKAFIKVAISYIWTELTLKEAIELTNR